MAYRPSRRLVISTAVILALVGVFIVTLPEVSRRLAINRLQSILTVPVAIEDVDVNLFTGRAAVENLIIGAPDPRPILSLPVLAFDFSRLGLLMGRINLESVFVHNPRLFVERLGPASYNVLEAVRFPRESDGATAGGFDLTIQRLEIDGGELAFIDHTQDPDYELTFSSVELAAGPITSLPDSKVAPTNFTGGVKIADGTVELAGSTTLFGETRETQITAEIANVELEKFNAYVPYGARLNLEGSSLAGQARYVLASRRGKAEKHYLDGTLTIGSVALLPAETQPVMRLAGATARDVHVDLLQNQSEIGALIINEPHLLVRRDFSGFNLRQIMQAKETAAENGVDEEESGGEMLLVIKKVETKGGRIEFIDETVTPVLESTFQDVVAAANQVVVLPHFATGEITAEGRLGKGSVSLTGNIDNEPLRGNFSVAAKQVPFEPFRGYLNQLFTSANASGDHINGQLNIAFAPENQGETVTSISGNLEGHHMALQFPDTDKPFLSTGRLAIDVRTIRIASNTSFDIDQIAFHGANLGVLRDQEGRLNVSRLWQSDEQEGSSSPQEQGNKGATTVAIRSVVLNESTIAIVDRSVSPNYTTTVSNVHGNLTSLLPSAKRAELKLEGKLGESAALTLSGWFTPFSEKPFLRLQGTIRSYALPPLNPYATEYISHRIQQGQITTEIEYTLKGDELQATSEIVLQNLRIGERTGDEFAQRIGIPLELAVALLQDINGVIRLQLAMNSDSGPKLNIASLVWSAVRNAIVRAITAPFRLVGKILTLGGRIGEIRVEPVVFEPGTREMEPESVKQLAELSELLKQKPQLKLELNGETSRDEVERLKKKKFWEKIQAAEGKNYEEALIRVYRDLGGITRPAPPLNPRAEESLEKFVMERIEVNDDELRKLARERAEIVKRELQERGIDPQRLSLSAAEKPASGENPAVNVELIS